MRRLTQCCRLAAIAVLFAGCAKKEIPVVEVKGACGDMFQASICTWARTQGTALVETGATVPLAALANAPADAPMAWPPVAELVAHLPEASAAQSGFTALTVFWEPMGHPPGPFLTPHFDFHFYLVPVESLAAIDCVDLSKPAALPAGYALPDVPLPPPMAKVMGVNALVGLCVPKMGMHALPAAELAVTGPFHGTMVIGYSKGTPIFIEPMVSRAMLMEKKSFDLPIPTIPGLTGPYPRMFHAEFDARAQSYRFVFSGFAPGA